MRVFDDHIGSGSVEQIGIVTGTAPEHDTIRLDIEKIITITTIDVDTDNIGYRECTAEARTCLQGVGKCRSVAIGKYDAINRAGAPVSDGHAVRSLRDDQIVTDLGKTQIGM